MRAALVAAALVGYLGGLAVFGYAWGLVSDDDGGIGPVPPEPPGPPLTPAEAAALEAMEAAEAMTAGTPHLPERNPR